MGSLRLRVHRARACASGGGNSVSFSGAATVTGGTATFAGARGRVSFRGSVDRATGSVRISLIAVNRYRADNPRGRARDYQTLGIKRHRVRKAYAR